MVQLRLDLGSGTRGHGSCHSLDIACCVLDVVMCERSRPISGHGGRNDSRRIVGKPYLGLCRGCPLTSVIREEPSCKHRPDQARFTPYASSTSRSVTMPSNLWTSARFTTGRISI